MPIRILISDLVSEPCLEDWYRDGARILCQKGMENNSFFKLSLIPSFFCHLNSQFMIAKQVCPGMCSEIIRPFATQAPMYAFVFVTL